MKKPIPVLLKPLPTFPDPMVTVLLDQAFNYLEAYRDSGDWGFLPTVKDAIAKIEKYHMKGIKHGSKS